MINKTTRQIKNFVCGRKLSSSEELNYEGLQTLMSSLHPYTWFGVSNSNLGDSRRNLKETTLMLEEHFKPSDLGYNYFDANHEVYSGQNERYDKHYVEVSIGSCTGSRSDYSGETVSWRNSPEYTATLEFEVLKGGMK